MTEEITCAIKTCHAKPNKEDHFFVIPHHFYVPNAYLLCEKHRNIKLDYEYFYDETGKNIYEKDKAET